MRSGSLLCLGLTLLLGACAPVASASAGNLAAQTLLPRETLRAPVPTQGPADTPVPTLSATAPLKPSTPTPRPTLGTDAWKSLPVVPVVSPSMRDVYQRGLAAGNDPTHISKIGDCQNVSTYFLSTFDDPSTYSLGSKYASLQPTIDLFQGSWSRQSLAVKPGFNVAAVLSPLRADPLACEAGESPLACELRVWRPSIVVVSMETWWGEKPADVYAGYLRQVVEYILSHGAVPILATKADNLEGDGSINAAVAVVASEYDVPVWNFWAAVQPLPDKGLSPDGFHLTFGRNFFDDPHRMLDAWPWRNLTALQAIDSVYRGLNASP
jgi:hypothetical protein